MGRTFSYNILIAWLNKQKADAKAKVEERLKAESQARAEAEERLKEETEARATVEQKVKAETEQMLLTQYRRYNVLAERAEAKANQAMAALADVEKKLIEAKQQIRTEALARAEVEYKLKAECQVRQRVEAQAKEVIGYILMMLMQQNQMLGTCDDENNPPPYGSDKMYYDNINMYPHTTEPEVP